METGLVFRDQGEIVGHRQGGVVTTDDPLQGYQNSPYGRPVLIIAFVKAPTYEKRLMFWENTQTVVNHQWRTLFDEATEEVLAKGR